MRKSAWSRSETKRPLSSVTVTGTITSLTCTLILDGWLGCSAWGGWLGSAGKLCAGGDCDWANSDRTTKVPQKLRERIQELSSNYSLWPGAGGCRSYCWGGGILIWNRLIMVPIISSAARRVASSIPVAATWLNRTMAGDDSIAAYAFN